MKLKSKACKHCKHCFIKKGLSGKVYFCEKQPQKTGVLVNKYAKVKPANSCKEFELKAGLEKVKFIDSKVEITDIETKEEK